MSQLKTWSGREVVSDRTTIDATQAMTSLTEEILRSANIQSVSSLTMEETSICLQIMNRRPTTSTSNQMRNGELANFPFLVSNLIDFLCLSVDSEAFVA
jgi:hypothetical protein